MMSLLALLATRHEPWDTLGDLWHPIWLIWWTVIGLPIHAILGWLLSILVGNPIADAVGPFGIAIVLLTILIKLIIAPVFQYQLTTSRRVQAEQRRIAPELAKVRKQYKKDPQRLNQETMALYKEHNINPLAQMSGCLPALVQSPILIMPVFIGFISLQFQTALALYWVVSNLFSIGQQYFITGWGSLTIPPVLRRGRAA